MSGPEVTLVVAAYNHERFIEDALEAAYAQTYPHLRVIITDDASRDGSQALITRLLQERGWEAQTILHRENRGICATFNEALALADTPYIAFVSADDITEPDHLATQVAALEAAGPDCAFACSDMALMSEEGSLSGRLQSDVVGEVRASGRTAYLELLQGDYISAPTVVQRTEVLRRLGGYDESLQFEDWDMWLRMLKDHSFVYSPRPLVRYRIVEGSLGDVDRTRERRLRFAADSLALLRKHAGQAPDSDRALTKPLFTYGRELYLAGRLTAGEAAPLLIPYSRQTRYRGHVALALLARLGLPGTLWTRLKGGLTPLRRPSAAAPPDPSAPR